MSITTALSAISGISFVYYGINCIISEKMKIEFIRFGLDQQRKLTGILQFFGGLGLLIGLYTSNLLAFISATGLFIMMLMGFAVRLKMRDSVLESAPSLVFALLNLYLSIVFYQLPEL